MTESPNEPFPLPEVIAALRRTQTVNIAIGMLVHNELVDVEEAFILLWDESVLSGRTISVVSAGVVETGNLHS